MNDITGRSQFIRNVVVSWGMHVFVLAAGFIVPRQISDSLGNVSLGIWDFGWATVRYMAVTNMGMAGALTRYSGLYRAGDDPEKLNQAITAVVIWQMLVSLIIVLGTVLVVWQIESLIDLPAGQTEEARWVMALLGGSIAVQMMANPLGALLGGYHRWDIQHTLNGLHDFGVALGIVGALLFADVDLRHLGMVVLLGAVVVAFARLLAVRRVCQGIAFGFGYWDWHQALKMLSYGSKLMLSNLPHVILFQSMAIILATGAGPAVLAVFNRGVALIRICEKFVKKAASTYTPMVSSLIGLNRREEARDYLLESSRFTLAMTLPMTWGLVFYGDLILLLWMGPEFSNRSMVALLALGTAIPIANAGPLSVLSGLNAIGRLSLLMFFATLVCLGVSIVVVNVAFAWDATVAAVVLGGSWTIASGLIIPLYMRHAFGVPLWRYLLQGIVLPVIYTLPLIVGMAAGRWALEEQRWYLMVVSWGASAVIALWVYFHWVLPAEWRDKILQKLRAS
ncbi:MAG: oligosaccharide flippase family protein [Ketobacteraceae bacterium]|nr:oligosaccharide flippase family protein [Ketobacteraceae bacterium]